VARQKNNSITSASYIIALLCALGCLWLFNTFTDIFGIWLIPALLILAMLFIVFPRQWGYAVGYVIRAIRRYRQRHRANLHEEERPYEQGYQAVSSSSNEAQQPLTVQELEEPYEAPQAQYPQQQAPTPHQ
jgi:endonuclease/exonuclease/phosphatase (EEP) superfamily protein YafD